MSALTQPASSRVGSAFPAYSHALRGVAKVAGFALLIGLLAQVKFFMPNNPVPVTLQTVGVLLCGFVLPVHLAVGAVALYLALGLAGLPMFAAFQAGQSTVTLGYLVGFLASAALVSSLVSRHPKLGFGRSLAISTAGTGVIFLFGVTWLALMLGDLERAIAVGLVPFAAWSVVKIGVSATLVAMAPRKGAGR